MGTGGDGGRSCSRSCLAVSAGLPSDPEGGGVAACCALVTVSGELSAKFGAGTELCLLPSLMGA